MDRLTSFGLVVREFGLIFIRIKNQLIFNWGRLHLYTFFKICNSKIIIGNTLVDHLTLLGLGVREFGLMFIRIKNQLAFNW